jgi:hypothetical protein
MRWIPLVLMLASCSPGDQPGPEKRLYAGDGRDRLCINGDRVGFIAYGAADTNCSVRGQLSRAGDNRLTIHPAGDSDCRITAEDEGESIRLGKLTEACAYYCGPGADFSGKAFTENPAASPAVDFAGDPLC